MISIDDIARKVKQPYNSVENVARKVKNGFIGIENVARHFYQSFIVEFYQFIKESDDISYTCTDDDVTVTINHLYDCHDEVWFSFPCNAGDSIEINYTYYQSNSWAGAVHFITSTTNDNMLYANYTRYDYFDSSSAGTYTNTKVIDVQDEHNYCAILLVGFEDGISQAGTITLTINSIKVNGEQAFPIL